MSTNTSSINQQLQEYNERLDRNCKRRFGVGIKIVKVINAITRLSAVAVGVLAIQSGADPMTVYLIVGAILVGPDFAEYVMANGQNPD